MMDAPLPAAPARRRWLESVLRGAVLLVLGLVAAWLGVRRRAETGSGADPDRHRCAHCRSREACPLWTARWPARVERGSSPGARRPLAVCPQQAGGAGKGVRHG